MLTDFWFNSVYFKVNFYFSKQISDSALVSALSHRLSAGRSGAIHCNILKMLLFNVKIFFFFSVSLKLFVVLSGKV